MAITPRAKTRRIAGIDQSCYGNPDGPGGSLEGQVPGVTDSDLDGVHAEAVGRLQAALLRGDAVSDGVRWLYYQHPVFAFALFTAAVHRRFGSGPDSDEISGFAARTVRAAADDASPGFRAFDAELLIRLSLGEPGLVEEISGDLNPAEIAIPVLDRLFAERPPGPVDVADLFAQAGSMADFLVDLDPGAPEAYTAAVDALPYSSPPTLTGQDTPGWRPDAASLPIDRRQLEAEVAACTQVLESDPRAGWALCRRARAYQAMGCHDEALADCARQLDRNPRTAWALCTRGECHLKVDDYEAAATDFTRALELLPDRAWVINYRGEAYRLGGHADEAMADFNAAIELERSAWALGRRGHMHRCADRHELAMADFTAALDLDPDDAFALLGRGETLAALGRHEDALADFVHADAVMPGDHRIVQARAGALSQLDRCEEAIAEYTRALALPADPDWKRSDYLGRGLNYQIQGRHEEAVADLTAAVAGEASGEAFPFLWRGRSYQALGLHGQALADYELAVQLDPDDPDALAHRGSGHRSLEHYELALADYDRAVSLAPDSYAALAGRAEVHLALDSHEAALADFARAIEIYARGTWALAGRAEVLRNLSRHDEAVTDYNRLLALDPEDADALAGRGQCLLAMGRADEGRRDIKRATELDPELAEELGAYLDAPGSESPEQLTPDGAG